MQPVIIVFCCVIALSSAFRNESEILRCGPNEIPSCVYIESTCRNRDIDYQYTPPQHPGPCRRKCICGDGFFRNSIGECITRAQCEQCDAPNEFYSCNSACDNVCDTIHKQGRRYCPIQNIVCNKWCYCDDGYARDSQKNCVPISACPKKTSQPGISRGSLDSN